MANRGMVKMSGFVLSRSYLNLENFSYVALLGKLFPVIHFVSEQESFLNGYYSLGIIF